ncbi:MAG: branched-chain amino acid transaminase [Actinobacteria bacterium]|nr:branched-chain amino acid transaminase [Actinomycetota bacterium]
MQKPQYAYFHGNIINIDDANVNIRTHSLQYGTAVFEGIRGYWNENEKTSYIFKVREHYERLFSNCKIMMISIKYDVDELIDITLKLCKKEDYREDYYIRPYAYKSSLTIGPKLVGLEDDFFIYTTPLGDYIDTENGIKVCVSSWQRVSDNALPARGKIAGSYVNAALHKTEAILDGYDEAIVLTQDGHVSEGSAMNLFLVKNNRLNTPLTTDDILEGITRRTIIELCRSELGIETVERKIDRTELYTADEMFFVGTGAQVSAIVEVDHRSIGSGRVGELTKKIMQLYFDVVRGKIKKYSNWLTKV